MAPTLSEAPHSLRVVLLPLLHLLVTAAGQDLFLASHKETSGAAVLSVRLGEVSGLGASPVTGRIRVYLQRSNKTLPVDGNGDGQDTNQVFGVEAHAWRPGDVVSIDEETLGYPVRSFRDLEPGVYFVQAELFRYTLYNRTGLPPTWLPTSCVSSAGSNGQYAKPDGTLFSKVEVLVLPERQRSTASVEFRRLGRDSLNPLELTLDRMQPKAVSPGCAGMGDGVDSKYVRTVRVRSEKLSRFWGMDIRLEACVLLPHGFDEPEHAKARYPLVIAHGHYSPQWFGGGGFRTDDPKCDPATEGYQCVMEQYNWYLYKNWTSMDARSSPFVGARMLLVTLNHPVPFFDDSYAVNTASMGPYGDAIVQELLPAIESQYRGLGAGWARGAMGGSTGGWESFAMPVFYPEDFNAAFAACPDPVTFTHYTSVNLYEQANAYYYDAQFKRTQTPGYRDGYSGVTWPGSVTNYGEIVATVEEQNLRELVLGTNSRSCGQFDAWEAVFSPVCSDGFPCRVYDKLSGKIDKSVANYWKEHFDLAHIIKRNWAKYGPKLNGSLHVFAGASDSFFLNDAVMDAQDLLEGIDAKHPTGIEWVLGTHEGRGYQHCFRGYEYDADGKPLPNSIARLMYAQAFLPRMAKRFAETAPVGADVKSWRY